jgi:hypothetical protein
VIDWLGAIRRDSGLWRSSATARSMSRCDAEQVLLTAPHLLGRHVIAAAAAGR